MTDRRSSVTVPVSFTAETREGRPVLRGKAAVFNSTSEDLGFREQLAPGCFRNALARKGDQTLLFAHDSSAILARRSAGTLTLTEESDGLGFEAELVRTTLGNDVAELCRSGHIVSCSFGFTVGDDEWSQREGENHRRVTEVRDLIEISLVGEPAYAATSVGVSARELAAEMRGRPKAERAPRITGDTRPPYGEHSRHSYFRDLANVRISDARGQANMTPGAVGKNPGGSSDHFPVPGAPTVEQSRRRLQVAEARAAATTAAGEGGELVPAGLPAQLSEAFIVGVSAAGVLPQVFGSEQVPKEAGLTPKIPGFTEPLAVVPQKTEGETVKEAESKTAYQSSGVELISGTTVVSQQLLDLAAAPGLDVEIATALGAILAQERDIQILNGSGSEHQTKGLLNFSGITASKYTDASPTAQKFITEGLGNSWGQPQAVNATVPPSSQLVCSIGGFVWDGR